MEDIKYKLEVFEGPLDLLLSLISKNKINIEDIPISLICEQYLEYIREAYEHDMDLASEFIVTASELMLIKSRMLLPKPADAAADPRKVLTDALIRYKQAKIAGIKLSERYVVYGGRMAKDTEEISADKKFVADGKVDDLVLAVKRIHSYNAALENAKTHVFTPLITKKTVSVELKIIGILDKMGKKGTMTLGELIEDEETLRDLVAAFVGVLELVKSGRLLLDDDKTSDNVHGTEIRLILNTDDSTVEETKEGLESTY